MIYPLPAVLVSCGKDESEYNIITVAWTGTICTNPPMCYISVRPERHSYDIHPLPRVNEIAYDVDNNPKAYYFQQAQNGLYAREAILCDVLGITLEDVKNDILL